jgi:hypothetical protein
VYDEVEYEGNSDRRWAQLSGRELVHRFWAARWPAPMWGTARCCRRPAIPTR